MKKKKKIRKNVIPEYKIEIEKLITFSEGKSVSGNYVSFFLFLILIFFLTLTIPAFLYPTHYTISENFISAMGDYAKNPYGAFIFNTGITIIGLLQIPIYLFLYQELRTKLEKPALISCIFSIISATGYIIVGHFPENLHIPHLIGAFLAFAGFFFAANIDLFIVIKMREKDDLLKNQTSFLEIIYFVICTVGVLYVCSTILNLFFQENVLHSYAIFSPSLWEWMYNLALILWLICMFVFLNEKVILEKIKKLHLFK
ncbi:MAG: DUF998 domain-containing protein [Promethearchaeota archaeon]